jgi:hypothetical protein
MEPTSKNTQSSDPLTPHPVVSKGENEMSIVKRAFGLPATQWIKIGVLCLAAAISTVSVSRASAQDGGWSEGGCFWDQHAQWFCPPAPVDQWTAIAISKATSSWGDSWRANSKIEG